MDEDMAQEIQQLTVQLSGHIAASEVMVGRLAAAFHITGTLDVEELFEPLTDILENLPPDFTEHSPLAKSVFAETSQCLASMKAIADTIIADRHRPPPSDPSS